MIPKVSMGDRTYTANWTPIAYALGYQLYNGLIAIENPLIYTIDSYTAKLLKEFLENGGKLSNYADTLPTRIDGRIADLSWLKPNISMADVAASSDVIARIDGKEALHVRVMERITDEGRMFYVFNFDKKPLNRVSFTVKNCGHLVSLDLETLEYKAIRGEKNADGSLLSSTKM